MISIIKYISLCWQLGTLRPWSLYAIYDLCIRKFYTRYVGACLYASLVQIACHFSYPRYFAVRNWDWRQPPWLEKNVLMGKSLLLGVRVARGRARGKARGKAARVRGRALLNLLHLPKLLSLPKHPKQPSQQPSQNPNQVDPSDLLQPLRILVLILQQRVVQAKLPLSQRQIANAGLLPRRLRCLRLILLRLRWGVRGKAWNALQGVGVQQVPFQHSNGIRFVKHFNRRWCHCWQHTVRMRTVSLKHACIKWFIS